MVNPTSNWDAVPVFGFYFLDDLTPASGNVKLTVTQRVTRVDGRRIYPEGATITRTIGDTSTNAAVRDAVRDAWRAADQAAQGASFDATAWNAWWNVMLTGAVFASFPANDDPDIVQTGYQVKVEEQLFSGGGREFYIEPTLAALASVPPGINLGMVDVPEGAPLAPAPIYAKGLPGGVAALDAQGFVVDAAGNRVTGGAAGALIATNNLSDLPNKATARGNLGLGTASTHPAGDFATPMTVAVTATASATLVAGQHTPVDATSGAKTMTLPTTAAAGVLLSVEKTDASTNAVTITGTLRGTTSSIPLPSQYEARTFLSEGSGSWRPVSDHRTSASLAAAFDALGAATAVQVANRLALARNPDLLITGTITRDANGAATSAPVKWPDGSPGTYTAITLSSAFPGAVDAYTITYGSPVTKTYTQPALTRDPATGAATNVPAITVA